MIGSGYWTTGVTLRYMAPDRWAASLDFFDDGFCDDGPAGISTQGTLATRYFVKPEDGVDPLPAALDALIADATRLGIRLDSAAGGPMLYVPQDGEGKAEEYHPEWVLLLAEQAKRLGWQTYGKPEETR